MNGAKLTELREARGISQVELARRAKMNQSQINRLESGLSRNPTRKTYEKIAAALGVSLAELIIALESDVTLATAA